MKIKLLNTYADKQSRLAEINSELEELEARLKTPARTLEDIIRHIELIKEKDSLKEETHA